MGLFGDEKLVIRGYSARTRSGLAQQVEVGLNPGSFTRRHEHQYARTRGINSSKNTATYLYSFAEELSFQLVIVDSDLTDIGLAALLSSKSVTDQIEKFKKVCYTMNGSIHQPNFLNIKWGTVDFDCKLKSMDIKYVSFTKDGKPRKAELDVVFVEDIPQSKAARMEGKSSPDLTHIITVKEGDTLPLLVERVYGSSYQHLYPAVARVNKLSNFRNLIVGQQLIFPPIDK